MNVLKHRMLIACALLLMAGSISQAATNAGADVEVPNVKVTAPPTYDLGDQVPRKRVAVMELNILTDNYCRNYYDQIKYWLPAMIEDQLLQCGWTLVVRGQRMKHVQDEHNLPGVKPGTEPPKNEILGATAFIELNARLQVRDVQGLIGYKWFTVGDWARATVDLNGQVVDPASGVLKESITTGGSASGVKTAAVITIGKDWKIGAGGYNLKDIKSTLVGKAADQAVCRFVTALKQLYPAIPGDRSASTAALQMDTQSTNVRIDIPAGQICGKGDRFGIYRGSERIAEVEVLSVNGTQAEARIISQQKPIEATDKVRRLPLLLSGD